MLSNSAAPNVQGLQLKAQFRMSLFFTSRQWRDALVAT
uniref:Uncharacterized protein n=1 Tax=Arundo donax TaxID=35708 RepID=A0A0A9B8E0_ARUDO